MVLKSVDQRSWHPARCFWGVVNGYLRPSRAHSLDVLLTIVRWLSGETCPLLLTTAGREPSDEAAIWSRAGQDRGATLASGVGELQTGSEFGHEGGWRKEKFEELGGSPLQLGEIAQGKI